MPMPTDGSAWPPQPHDIVLAACTESQVWWEGDPDKLAQFYGGGGAAYDDVAANRLRVRAKRAYDAWWGRAQPAQNRTRRLHVPVAADIGRVAASTLFSEPPKFDAADDNAKVQERADLLLNTPDMHSRLVVAAESASMLSGTYGRIVWDDTVAQHAWIDFVDADRAIPTFRWGRLTDVLFFTELAGSDDRIVYRHLELYRAGAIEHALYVGTPTSIGRRRSLLEHPDTEAFAPLVRTGVAELTAAYIPNHRPAPAWRREPALAPLGRSDLTRDVIHILDAIDECWSSWMRDLDLGKGRIMISERLMDTNGPGRGSSFNFEQAAFSPIKSAEQAGEVTDLIEINQFAIRVDEHRATFEALLRRAISRCGFSPITFGLADEVAVTATEVDAKERDTNATRALRLRLWSAPLAELATTLLRVDAFVFNTGAAPSEPLDIQVPPAHQQSQHQLAETVELMNRAAAVSIETKVKMLHSDWDDQQVEDEVQRIQDESGGMLPPLPTEGNEGDPFAPIDPAADPAEQDDPAADPGAPETDGPTK